MRDDVSVFDSCQTDECVVDSVEEVELATHQRDHRGAEDEVDDDDEEECAAGDALVFVFWSTSSTRQKPSESRRHCF